ncbi:LamG domain-containing protein [Devosia beringensis]|uniref:LamG domain-containing protein n=1 Tax=Devosia beringensis TaxID=2657486 RepID=UPI00186B68D4|nr:LamG domain-containing protein [Devosia beringensis]
MNSDLRAPMVRRSNISRRNFIVGAAGLAIAPAFAQSRGAENPVAYISPTGQGDGLSLQQPASLALLGDLIKAVGPGGTVFILADRGSYHHQLTVEIAAGGTSGAPVLIMGANAQGQPLKATIRGNRKRWRRPTRESRAINAAELGGDTTFVFAKGASHLIFSSLSLVDTGRVFDFTDQTEGGITIEDVDFHNVRDGFFTSEESELSNVVIRRFSGVGFSKKAIRVHGRSHDWMIEDCELDSGWQFGDNFAVGIELNHEAHDISIRGGFTINCLDKQDGDPEKYWNADGIASENGNYNVSISDHRSAGNSDGGYDLKSEATVLTRCVAEDNKRNYRIWGGMGADPLIMEKCQSLTPRSRGGTGAAAHLWLFGSDGDGASAASAIFRDGVMADSASGSAVVYVDGGNVAVHLIDTDLTALGKRESLVESEGEGAGNSVVVGSASDPDLRAITTPAEISAIEGFSKTVILTAEGAASWRIIDPQDSPEYTLSGSSLTLSPAVVGNSPRVTIQARGSNGVSVRKTFYADIQANPMGAGTALAISFAGVDGATIAEDQTGLNIVEFAGEAQILDNTLVFSRGEDFVTIPDSDNFSFSGPFTIDTEFMIDNPLEEGGQDVLSHWGDASRQRGYVIRCEEAGSLTFAWTYDGTDQNVSWIEGPALEAARYYKVRVDRDNAGTMRLYVDGRMVGRKTDSGTPILNAAVPLRISGRANGKYGANGRMRSLLINNGYALTGSDLGYQH